jgi:hypothetical protein
VLRVLDGRCGGGVRHARTLAVVAQMRNGGRKYAAAARESPNVATPKGATAHDPGLLSPETRIGIRVV